MSSHTSQVGSSTAHTNPTPSCSSDLTPSFRTLRFRAAYAAKRLSAAYRGTDYTVFITLKKVSELLFDETRLPSKDLVTYVGRSLRPFIAQLDDIPTVVSRVEYRQDARLLGLVESAIQGRQPVVAK